MKPVSPVIPNADAEEVVYAKDQPEYQPLPSVRLADGRDTHARWALSDEEKIAIAEQGYIYLEILTFNRPLQPLRLSIDVPEEFSVAAAAVSNDSWPDVIQ